MFEIIKIKREFEKYCSNKLNK